MKKAAFYVIVLPCLYLLSWFGSAYLAISKHFKRNTQGIADTPKTIEQEPSEYDLEQREKCLLEAKDLMFRDAVFLIFYYNTHTRSHALRMSVPDITPEEVFGQNINPHWKARHPYSEIRHM